MKAFLQAWLAERRQFVLYCSIGLIGATLDFVVYCGLVHVLRWHHQMANLISISCGVTNNFWLNTVLNFKVRDRLMRRFALFYGVGCFGLGLSALMLWVGVDRLGLEKTVAKLITIVVIVVVQYNLNRTLSFRRTA